MDVRLTKFLLLSCIIHFSLILFVRVESVTREPGTRLVGIDFIEEKEEKEKKKEKKKKMRERPRPIEQAEPTKSLADALRNRFKSRKINPELETDLEKLDMVRPMEVAPSDAKIDIGKIQELAKMQAAIDLNSYEPLNASGEVEVVRVGTEGKSIEEILEEPTIALPRTKEELNARVGLFTSPGSGGKTIELEKVDISELKKSAEAAGFKKKQVAVEMESMPGKKAPATEVEIAGALAERKLIEKPLPTYPDWALRRGLSAVVSVKITVGPDGKPLPEMLILHTTGYGEWDKLVTRTLAKWRWESCPITHVGRITFRFTLGV